MSVLNSVILNFGFWTLSYQNFLCKQYRYFRLKKNLRNQKMVSQNSFINQNWLSLLVGDSYILIKPNDVKIKNALVINKTGCLILALTHFIEYFIFLLWFCDSSSHCSSIYFLFFLSLLALWFFLFLFVLHHYCLISPFSLFLIMYVFLLTPQLQISLW